jgi:hypothetical protein
MIRMTKKQAEELLPVWVGMVVKETPKRTKYNSRTVEVQGKTFQSALEARRFLDLQILERAGEIRNLKRQVPFRFEINGFLICEYFADHVYEEGGRTIVEDVKGVRTAMYLLKKKLMRAFYGVEIKEVTDGRRRTKSKRGRKGR